eukprot:1726561-Pleurochrysis_carterae.AAC.1
MQRADGLKVADDLDRGQTRVTAKAEGKCKAPPRFAIVSACSPSPAALRLPQFCLSVECAPRMPIMISSIALSGRRQSC